MWLKHVNSCSQSEKCSFNLSKKGLKKFLYSISLLFGGIFPFYFLVSVACYSLDADVYIVVLATPDGRGELESSRDSCLRTNGNHVDLNRNFPWNFGASGSTYVHFVAIYFSQFGSKELVYQLVVRHLMVARSFLLLLSSFSLSLSLSTSNRHIENQDDRTPDEKERKQGNTMKVYYLLSTTIKLTPLLERLPLHLNSFDGD